MKTPIDSLVNLIEQKSKDDPKLRRIWATAIISNKFSALVRSLRNQRQLSEEQLAEQMGCPLDIVLGIENPNTENIPGLEDMVAAAEALGFELSINLNTIFPDVTLDRVDASIYNTVINDVRVLTERHRSSQEVNRSIAIVSVNSGGNVLLPNDIEVEKDSSAFFHNIPIQVNSDDS